MPNVKSEIKDKVMLELLKQGAPMQLGIPAWMLKNMASLDDDALRTPEIIRNNLTAFIEESVDLKGYQFSWGSLHEEIYQHISKKGDNDDRDLEALRELTFEICPTQILKNYPHADILEDAMVSMYRAHPLKDMTFNGGDADGCWNVLQFSAYGTQQSAALRTWMANIFIPIILPELLASAKKIVNLPRVCPEVTARALDLEGEEPQGGNYIDPRQLH